MNNSSTLAKLFQTAPYPKHLIPAFQKHPELSAIVFTPGLAVVQIDLKRRLFFFDRENAEIKKGDHEQTEPYSHLDQLRSTGLSMWLKWLNIIYLYIVYLDIYI